jgi:DNA end-binding protein Ku
MWNGTLVIGKLSIDVKLYAAIEDAAVHFHLLHDRDLERLEQHMVNPSTGEVREKDEIHRGFEVKPGTFVLLEPSELEQLEPPPSRSIEAEAFVPEAELGPVWYERPYHLGPASKSPEYTALARVLAERKRIGIVRWVMRKRAYVGALRSNGEHLTLSTLHDVAEVVSPPKVAPASRAADERELGMAEQLVEALAGEFDPEEFADEHRERVRELLAAKARGKAVKLPPRERRRAPRPLGTALEQSLKLLKGKGAPSKRQPEPERRSA